MSRRMLRISLSITHSDLAISQADSGFIDPVTMHRLSGAGNDICHTHSQHKQKLNQYEFMKGNGICDLHTVSAPLRFKRKERLQFEHQRTASYNFTLTGN